MPSVWCGWLPTPSHQPAPSYVGQIPSSGRPAHWLLEHQCRDACGSGEELLSHHVSNLLSPNLDHRGAHQTEVGAPRDPQMLSCRWRRGNFLARLGELKKQPGGAFSLRAPLGSHLDPAVHKIGFIFSILQMRTLGHREAEQWAWPTQPESGWLDPKGVRCLCSFQGGPVRDDSTHPQGCSSEGQGYLPSRPSALHRPP